MGNVIDRSAEGNDPDAVFSWDSEWVPWDPDSGKGGYADFAIADENETDTNIGGLKSQNPLATAVQICLFTNKRRPDDMPINDGGIDPQGWHGDSYDVDTANGERELGSYLWTLERQRLTHVDRLTVIHYAADAVQTLVDQGVVDHFEIDAEFVETENRMNLQINAFDVNGKSLFANTYTLQ